MSPEPTPVQAISHGVKYLGDNYCRYGCLVLIMIVSQLLNGMMRYQDIFKGPQNRSVPVIFATMQNKSTHRTQIIWEHCLDKMAIYCTEKPF